MLRARVVLAVVVCAGAGAPSAWAQIASGGSIRGYVKDQQGAALPGVTLIAASPAVPRAVTGSSDDEGHYRLIDLAPGEYTLTAELPGFTRYSREGIVVRAGLNLSVDITMQIGSVTETVEVRLDTPILESFRPGQSINIAGNLQRSVPLTTRRDWAQFMELTPGVVARQASQFQNYYFHGSSSSSHVFLVDGVDVMSAQSNSNIWISLSDHAIADVAVTTGATDAAAPLGVGAVANVRTFSGSNQFRGNVILVHQARRWNDSNTSGGTTSALALTQVDATLGGPAARDHVWFFAAYRHTNGRVGISRALSDIALFKAVDPQFKPFDNTNIANLTLARLTAQLNPKHQLRGFIQYDRNPRGNNAAHFTRPLTITALGGPVYAVQLSSTWSNRLTGNVSLSYNSKGQENKSLDSSNPSRVLHNSAFLSGGRVIGSGVVANWDSAGSGQEYPYSKTTVTADLQYLTSGRFGRHELRLGAYSQRATERQDLVYSNGGAFLEEHVPRVPGNLAAGTRPFHLRISDVDRFSAFDLSAADDAIYLQDLWQALPRLSILAGVRIDWVRRKDRIIDAHIQNSTEVGPRLGATYAVDSDRRTVAHVNVARIHDALPVNSFVRSRSGSIRDLYDVNGDEVFDTEFVSPGSIGTVPDRVFDAAFHQPFVDQWSLGLRRQLGGQLSLDGTFTRRKYRDIGTIIEVNGIYENNAWRGFSNTALNEIGLVTNNRYNRPVYSDLTVSAANNSPRLRTIASYTRQWRHLEGTWQPGDPAGILQPAAFPNNRAIGDPRGNVFSVYNSYTASTGAQWWDHAIRAGLSVPLPAGLSVASAYSYQSGLWSGPILTRLSAPDPRFGPATLVVNGRVASNPLASVVRFAYPTRREGQLKTPGLHVLNLRIGWDRQIRMGRMSVAIDVLNLPNAGADQAFRSLDRMNPNFGLLFLRQPPRSAQLSVAYSF